MIGMPARMIELNHAGLRLALRPDLGGCIAGLWHNALPVLRSTEPAALIGPRQSACFAMLPYSNRLGLRRFEWQGKRWTTAANFDDSPHSLHGVAWQQAWRVLEQHETRASLGYAHSANTHWPFAFEARQDFELTPGRLTLRLTLRNTDAVSQPVGLGWHPYFPVRQSSALAIRVSTRWDSGADQLPQHKVDVSHIESAVQALDLDNCFEGWQEPALITDECLRLRLSSSLNRLVIFTPPDHDFFCIEPVSHVNNAIQHADPLGQGLCELLPDQTLQAWMTLDIENLR